MNFFSVPLFRYVGSYRLSWSWLPILHNFCYDRLVSIKFWQCTFQTCLYALDFWVYIDFDEIVTLNSWVHIKFICMISSSRDHDLRISCIFLFRFRYSFRFCQPYFKAWSLDKLYFIHVSFPDIWIGLTWWPMTSMAPSTISLDTLLHCIHHLSMMRAMPLTLW